MNGASSFEHLLIDFSHVLVPFGEELGGVPASATATSLLASIKPFITLFGLNLAALSLRHYIIRIGICLFEISFGLVFYWLFFGGLLTHRSSQKILRARLRKQQARPKKPTTIKEDNAFKPWNQFCHGTVFWSFGGELNDEVRHALTILGIHAFSTQCDVRKAYLDLMKKYHPDHFMQKPDELEQAQHTAVKVREAYDRISKQFCQVQ